MGILHDELKRAIGESWTDGRLRNDVLQIILRNQGVELSDAQFQSSLQAIENGADSVNLPGDGPELTVSISDEVVERAISELERKLDADSEKAITRIVDQLAPRILHSLYVALPEALREWHAIQRAFEQRLCRRWKAGLDRLDMLITMAHEAGETFIEDLRCDSDGSESSDAAVLFDVLAALHCRACRTAREIVCLLKGGYADGAHARWRSLHELAVTAFFLLEHRGDTPQRYLDHADVERWRAAKQYQQHCHTLGYEPFSEEELAQLEGAANAAVAKYGPTFESDYGWAARALGHPRPTFTQIEANLDMSHWRPNFRLACQSVHAGSQGLFFALGLPHPPPSVLLAGASDAGLADPGHHMAISLTMATVAFLTVRPNLDGLIACRCLLTLCDDIGQELLRVHEAQPELADPGEDVSVS